MGREPESAGRRVLRLALIVLLLPIILPLAILGLVFSVLNKVVVYLLLWVWWLPQGKDVLYVSSDSPIWKEYMEADFRTSEALAHDITKKQKEVFCVPMDQIAVVPAHRPGGRVVEVELPAIQAKGRRR